MNRKTLLLFLLVCFLSGVAAFLGSILGHALGKTGLYAGAILGGMLGVGVAAKIAVKRQMLDPKQFWPATIGGILGFLLAAIIATNNLSTPVVPLASILLIGLGAVLGAGTRQGKSIG
jgi:hypothetical protein